MTTFSCKESFLDSVPSNKVNTGDFYRNDDDFIKATNGIYTSAFTPYRQDMEYFPWIDMATPIAVKGGGRFGVFQWGGSNQGFTATNYHGDQKGWWNNWWIGVARANEVIARVGQKGGNISTDALRNRVLGEAKFLRAQLYFFLTYIWGDVPLYKEPVTDATTYPKRAPHAEVVELMIQDLKDAETLLPSVTEYRNKATNMGRASRGAAMGLLGKIYCFEKRWAEAEDELNKVILSNDYQLIQGAAGFNSLFLPTGENGLESIFEIQYGIGFGDALGNAFVTFCARGNSGIDPGGNGNNYIEPTEYLTDKYETINGYSVHSEWISRSTRDSFQFTSADPAFDPLKSFENRDPRLMYTVMYEGSPYLAAKWPKNTFTAAKGTESNYATAKYIYPQPAAYQSEMNMVVMRYADVLLLYAEACMEQNTDAKRAIAVTNVNLVRSRVGMPGVPANVATDETLLRNYIHDERIRELACEYGHVFFDMRRWGTWVQEMKSWYTANKHGRGNTATLLDEHNVLWPISKSELDANVNLKQNPGY